MGMWLFSHATELLIPETGTHKHSLFRFQDGLNLSYRVCVKSHGAGGQSLPFIGVL